MTLLGFHFVHVRSDTLFTIGYFCDPIDKYFRESLFHSYRFDC